MSEDIEPLISNLIKSNCINEEYYRYKNGNSSKYYFNIKNLMSDPILLKTVGDELYKKFVEFDVICCISYKTFSLASYISIKYNKPLVYLKTKIKNNEVNKFIEGKYNNWNRCIIIDDVFDNGDFLKQAVSFLTNKINIVDIVVVVDKQENDTLINNLHIKALIYKNDYIKYKLKQITQKKRVRLCFAADIEDPEKILNILESIGDYIVICKIHLDIINIDKYNNIVLPTKNKRCFIEDLIKLSIKHNFLIMEDRKFIDSINVVKKQYNIFNSWIDLITVHSIISSDIISILSGVIIVANTVNDNYDFYERAGDLVNNNSKNVIGFLSQNVIKIDNYNLICLTPYSNKNINHGQDNKKDENIVFVSNNIINNYTIVGEEIYDSLSPIDAIQNFISYGV